jgi:squalene synthase HpnC
MSQPATGEITMPERQEPLTLPGEQAIQARAGGENFSVASLLLPRPVRGHLLAIYGYARLVDQIGDAAAGDRLAALDLFELDFSRIFEPGSQPTNPVLVRLAPTVHALDLPEQPFRALIEANRRDQLVSSYASFQQLLDYCALSANPVGELVLRVFGVATAERIELSDAVCTALQLAEHWQDVAEDFRAGRIYLPAEDRERFGVEPADLAAPHAGAQLRALLAFEVARASTLLDRGAALVGTLRGSARIAVAGYVAGGRAALEAISAAGHDVLAGAPTATRRARARHTVAVYRRGR